MQGEGVLRLVAAVLVTGVLFTGFVARSANSADTRGVPAFWMRVANCETGGKWDWGSKHRPEEGHTYEGGVGFYWGTWRLWASELGLLGRFPHAYNAPPQVQVLVAEHGLAEGGYWGAIANGCARR